MRLADLHYTADGTLTGPARQPCAGEEVLGGYLRNAAEVIGEHPDDIDDGPTGLPPDFETLRRERLRSLHDGHHHPMQPEDR